MAAVRKTVSDVGNTHRVLGIAHITAAKALVASRSDPVDVPAINPPADDIGVEEERLLTQIASDGQQPSLWATPAML